MQSEGKDSGDAWDALSSKIDEVGKRIKIAERDLQKLVDTGKAFTSGFNNDEYAQLSAQVEQLNQQMQSDTERQAELQAQIAEREERIAQIRENAVAGNQRIIETVERIKQLEQEIADLKTAGITEGYADYDERITELSDLKQEVNDYRNSLSDVPEKFSKMSAAAQKAFNIIRSGLSMAGSLGKKAFSNMSNSAKKAFSAITIGSKQSNASLSGGIKAILKYGLGIRSLYVLVSKIRTGIKNSFTNLMGYSEDFANSIQSVKNSMKTLGNQIAGAFRPIVEMVIPWLNSLINALTSAMAKLAQFIAALGGKSTFTKAKQIQDKYNQSLIGTAKAADKARGALAKFDDLDVLQKQEDTSGGNGIGTDTGDLFEEASVESSVSDFFQMLKSLIYGEDWEGLGSYIAEALNQGLIKIYDVINWNNVGPQITYFVTAFTSTLNSLVDNLDWNSLGETIGAEINTMVNTLFLVISNIDWENLGNKLSEGADSLVIEVDFTNVGNLIGEKFMILPRILLGFVSNLDWSAIGTEIGNVLNGIVDSIDLSQIGEMLGKSLTGIFQAAIDFFTTFDWVELGTSIYEGINAFFENTDWEVVGQGISDFVLGLLDSLIVAIEGTDWQQVGNNVADFIGSIDWTGIMERLFEGIGAALGGLAAFLWGLIEDAWNSVIDWWKERMFEDGEFTLEGFLLGILEWKTKIDKWINEHIFKPFMDGFKKAFGIHSPSTVMAEMGRFVMQGLLNGIRGLVGSVKEIWLAMKNTAVNIWNSIKDNVSNIIANTKSTIVSVLALIKNAWNSTWSELKTSVINIFGGIWPAIKSTINSILGGVEKMANGVINALNSMIRALNSIHFDIPDWVPALGGKSFGFSIGEVPNVSIPKLATGAVIRGGNPFMAILGDQPRGVTNIETPLPTMVDAFKQAISEMGGIGSGERVPVNVNIIYDGETTARVMIPDILSELDRQGYNVNLLGYT